MWIKLNVTNNKGRNSNGILRQLTKLLWIGIPIRKDGPTMLINTRPLSPVNQNIIYYVWWVFASIPLAFASAFKQHSTTSHLVKGNLMGGYDDWCCRLVKLTWHGVYLPHASLPFWFWWVRLSGWSTQLKENLGTSLRDWKRLISWIWMEMVLLNL